MNNSIDLTNLQNKKTALVLSGGVVKAAAWHLGVTIALKELGFVFRHNNSPIDPPLEISTYVGSSAGSLVNLFLACGHAPQDVIDATLKRNKSTNSLVGIGYGDILSLKKPQKSTVDTSFYNPLDVFPFLLKKMAQPLLSVNGFFTTEGLNLYMQKHLIHSQNFSDYKADMFVVATKLDHSDKVIFSKYNYPSPIHDLDCSYYTDVKVTEAICGSMSVPPFYSPYPIVNQASNQTYYYIDGEIRETLSTHVAVDNHCETIISSWTHTPYHYQQEIGSLVNFGLPAICTQAIYLMIQRKIMQHRDNVIKSKDIVNTVGDYMRQEKFETRHIEKILTILETKLNYKANVRFIDIFPDHGQSNIFFANPFSLDSKNTESVINAGYKKTYEVFRNLEL